MVIKSLKAADVNCGGKANGLAKLIKLGVNVPNGFVIENSMNLDYDELKERLTSLGGSLAIRSSAYGEDGSDKSFAGVFESYLNVENNINEVMDKIKLVNLSNKNGKKYYPQYKGYMNVIVQDMVNPLISGVLFTKAFDLAGREIAFLNYTEGLGDKLVGGLVSGKQFALKKGEKGLDFCSIKNVSNADVSIFKLLNKELEKLDLSKKLDIEFCISKDLKAYILQARPITSKFLMYEDKGMGIVTSAGYAEGKVYVIKNGDYDKEKEMIANFPEGGILVAGVSGYAYEQALTKAKAIITEEGSTLSHASIVARELGIPCIAGFVGATDKFKTGDDIIVDTYKNKLVLNGNEVFLDSNTDFNYGELFCFDSVKLINYNNFLILADLTPKGIVLNIGSQKIDKETLKDLDLEVRKIQGFPVVINRNYKFDWYFNIMNFKNLPYFDDMIKYAKDIIKNLDSLKMIEFYNKILNAVTDLHDIYFNSSLKNKVIIYEMVSAYNIILYGIIPMGYAMRYCYEETYDILTKMGKKFNDLLSGNFYYQNNDKLKEIHDFLVVVSNLKVDDNDNVKVRFPEFIYIDLEKLILNYFDEEGINKKGWLLDDFYASLDDRDFDFIRKKFTDDFYKSGNKQKIKKL